MVLKHSGHPAQPVCLLGRVLTEEAHVGLHCRWERPYLSPTVRSFLDAEADEAGVGHPHQDVVHTVDVDAPHAPSLHVLYNVLGGQGPVQTTVPICKSNSPLAARQDPHGANPQASQHGPQAQNSPKEIPVSEHRTA